ncbi:MAG: hypothetical protein LBP43_02200 [Treponema sp.]|jgi:hypothetical protein|nr:hypothetical protein [Treponema sp.]
MNQKSPDLDEILSFKNRTLRTMPGKLLLGPTGARLWADYLDPVPGFRGRIDFIHKLNIPLLFQVMYEGSPEEMEPVESLWQPSMLEMFHENERVKFREYKFITWDDQALSLQIWENKGTEPVKLFLKLPGYFTPPDDGGWALGHPGELVHGIKPVCLFFCGGFPREGLLVLPPGERVELVLAFAMGNEKKDDITQIKTSLEKFLLEGKNINGYVRRQREEYNRWFDAVPVFECSDPLLEHTWWYRWFILRHNLARPDFGNFHHTLFYEGRSHKTGKEPFKPSGWEFSKLIPLSTPLHLTDFRWYGDREIAEETVLSLCDSMDGQGLFRVLFTDDTGNEYANFAAWALYGLYLVHRDTPFIKKILGCFKKNVRGVYECHRGEGDHLQIEYRHSLTGKEYQPGYWYFTGYPDNVKDKSGYTPLKRVDRSVYTYLNALAVAYLCDSTGDGDGEEFFELAGNIGQDILNKMWEKESAYFYDLHYQTDEKAPVKNIVGIYPLWAGLTGPEHIRALDHLLDPKVFNTGCPFASTSRDCPVFSAEGGWKGHYIKGRNGCMWNGPSWPYTTGIALDALAIQSKQNHHTMDVFFMAFLRAYSLQHYQGHDIRRPYLTEHYNSITGEAISDEADYLHSYYIDLIIRHVAGIEPDKEGFVFHPCRCGLTSFSLKNLIIQNHRVDVFFAAREDQGEFPKEEGVRIYINGVLSYKNKTLPDKPVKFRLE